MERTLYIENLGPVTVEYELETYPYPVGGPVTVLSATSGHVPHRDITDVLTETELDEIKGQIIDIETTAYERHQAALEDAADARREARLERMLP